MSQPILPLYFRAPISSYNRGVMKLYNKKINNQHYRNYADFVFIFKQNIIETDQRLRSWISEGIYDWFRPIEGSAIMKKMIETNKELQMKRSEDLRKLKKCRVAKDDIIIEQGVDVKGEQYIDYILDESGCKLIQVGKEAPGKHKKGSQYTFTEKQWTNRAKSGNYAVKDSFQLYLLGLDLYNYTTAQLRTTIYEELNRKIGKVVPECIQFIDPHSLISICE